MPLNLVKVRNFVLGSFFLVSLSFASATLADDKAEEPAPQVPIAVGQEAPAVLLQGSDGETYDSNLLRGEKNLLLIFFRGTW